MKNVSIVYTHWAENTERSQIMRESFASLLRTAPEAEIIVCDNGGSYDDSRFLMCLCDKGLVASYTRFRKNMHFYYARNDALRRASRDFIAVSDNDILFEAGWLEECVGWLEKTPGKYLATPIAPDPMNAARAVRWAGEANGWRLNYRAGSNIWVMRRSSFEEIGPFDAHRVSGSKWCDRYGRLGYTVGVMPIPKAKDLAFRKGYNFALATDLKRAL